MLISTGYPLTLGRLHDGLMLPTPQSLYEYVSTVITITAGEIGTSVNGMLKAAEVCHSITS
jgi:hypothetical protein